MTKGVIFWILMLLWLIFGMWLVWPDGAVGSRGYYPIGGNLLLFVLLALLGWKTFGSPVQD